MMPCCTRRHVTCTVSRKIVVMGHCKKVANAIHVHPTMAFDRTEFDERPKARTRQKTNKRTGRRKQRARVKLQTASEKKEMTKS